MSAKQMHDALERGAYRTTPTGFALILLEGTGTNDAALRKIRARRRRRDVAPGALIRPPKGAA